LSHHVIGHIDLQCVDVAVQAPERLPCRNLSKTKKNPKKEKDKKNIAMHKDKKGPCLNNKFNPTYNIAHCIYVKHYLLTLCLK